VLRRDLAKHAVTATSLVVLAGALYYAFHYDRAAPGAPLDDAGPRGTATEPFPGTGASMPAPPAGDLHPAPVNVFADAAEGDWSAFQVHSRSELLDATSTVLWQVTSVSDDSVIVGGKGRLVGGKEQTLRDMVFPRSGLTLERLLELDYGEWTILTTKTSEEPHEVGGRTFECTKVVFTSRDPLFPGKQTETQIWFSRAVNGSGIVESREVQQLGEMRFEITKTLIGFGTATATTWGERPIPPLSEPHESTP